MSQKMSSPTQKLETWQPQKIPMSDGECEEYRVLCRQSIFARWRNKSQASTLQDIYGDVVRRVKERINAGDWPYDPFVRSKRSIDRRVNETAEAKYYPKKIVMVVAVSAGLYAPNPSLFMEKPVPKNGRGN